MFRCSAGGNGRARPGVPRSQQRACFREGRRGSCGYVSTVDSAGSVDSAVYTATSNSKANKREETDTNTKTVFKDACNLRASKPEVDLLAALNAAASDLQANAVGNRKAICVVASGISTTGLLATTPELLAADAHDVAAQLRG